MKLSNPDSGSSITIGQQWDLVFPIEAIPESLAHIAFPLGFATGMIGWRFPGIVYSQALGKPSPGSLAWGLDVGAFSGSWNGPAITLILTPPETSISNRKSKRACVPSKATGSDFGRPLQQRRSDRRHRELADADYRKHHILGTRKLERHGIRVRGLW